jgi:hypothetical protein
LHKAYQADLQVKPRLQRGLQILKQLQRERQISREIFLGKLGRDLGHPLPLGDAGCDQSCLRAGNPRHQQIAEVSRQLAAEVLQVLAVTFQLVDHLQHAA